MQRTQNMKVPLIRGSMLLGSQGNKTSRQSSNNNKGWDYFQSQMRTMDTLTRQPLSQNTLFPLKSSRIYS